LTSLRTVDVAPAGFVLNFVQVDASDSYRYGKYRYQPAQADTNSTPAPRKAPSARGTRASRRQARRAGS
jgi:hypothetical protein